VNWIKSKRDLDINQVPIATKQAFVNYCIFTWLRAVEIIKKNYLSE